MHDIATIYPLFYDFGFALEEIHPETRIEEDLGITGLDAVRFIAEFGKLTKVDVSEFMAADYFWPEGSFLYRLIGWRRPSPKKVLQVKHLLTAVQKGVLNEETINQSWI